MATIEDVAKRSGVSVATVSRVVNGTGVVSAKLSQRVRDAIAELEYRPNFSGRNLRLNETRTLLVICSVAMDVMLDGIYAAADELGYRIIVHYIGGCRQHRPYIDEWFYGNVDGALLYAAYYPDDELNCISRTLPLVQCCSYLDLPNAARVSIDEEGAAFDMANHLLSRGFRVGMASLELPEAQDTFVHKRERGYRRALEARGVAFDPELVLRCEIGYEANYALGRRLAALRDRMDCVFCVHDSQAMTVVRALQDEGLRVPEDMAVAGFDDMELAKLCRPRLTTIAQPFSQIGNAAARLLVSQIRGENVAGREVFLRHELIERESTKK